MRRLPDWAKFSLAVLGVALLCAGGYALVGRAEHQRAEEIRRQEAEELAERLRAAEEERRAADEAWVEQKAREREIRRLQLENKRLSKTLTRDESIELWRIEKQEKAAPTSRPQPATTPTTAPAGPR